MLTNIPLSTPPLTPPSRGGEPHGDCGEGVRNCSQKTPLFFLIAGEASGDILGARLMRALKQKLNGNVQFAGIGGPQMIAEELDLLFPHTELMHFGLIEVLRHIPRLLKRIDQTAEEVLRVNPAALITIDAPDFCLRVAKQVRKHSGFRIQDSAKKESSRILNPESRILLIHYVAPTVWAWRAGRAKKIAKFLDHLLAVLPFEPPYFTREGLGCTFVGHSIVESDCGYGSNAMFRMQRHIPAEAPLLALLPGSRISEINRLLPVFRDTVQILRNQHPDLQIVVPVVPHLQQRIADEIATWDIPFHIVEGERAKYDAFAASRAALACSGTIALELALARLPAVIAYKMNALTVALFRHFVRVRYANLVNIMHNKMVVPEFLQDDCAPEKLAHAVDILLRDEKARQAQIAQLAATAGWLGQGQFVPSERAAETILKRVEESGIRIQDSGQDAKRFSFLNAESRMLNASLVHAHTVLQVLPALVTGGVERGTVDMVAALVKNGDRAIVASSGGAMASEIIAAGGIHVTLPLKSKNPLVIYKNIERLCRVIRAYKVDIVHARSRAPAWSASFAAKKTGAHFVTTFHSAYGAGSKIKRLYNSVMGKGARVIAISNFVADYAERTYNIPREIIRVIPRGVDIEKFDRAIITPERIDALRRAWNLADNMPVILMPGRLTRWKGQSVLIKALETLQRRDFICVIVGGGKDSAYGKELARDIEKAQLDQNIIIADTCRDMAAAYALASLVIVPSTRPEGFGRVVIEAQAMGVPVIASDHGGAVETVIAGETGWLTPAGDAKALARAIATVLDMSRFERELFALRATNHIRARFTNATMTGKTLEVYRELVKPDRDDKISI